MPLASYKVYVDWSGDGTFAQANEDVTRRVLDARQSVTMSYGRDQVRALSPIKVGVAGFALNNRDRYLSPENSSSPLYGLVKPGRRVRITATVGGVDTVLYSGYLDDFDLKPDFAERYVGADCIDALGRLRGQKVSTAVYQGLRPGEAIGVLLDAVGWPADRRDLETGATMMPFWWLDEADAYDALMELVASEGPPALATVDSSDRLVFRGRHHRLQRAASLTAQSTWYSSGVEPMISPPAQYGHGWKEIINSVVFQLPQRSIAGDLSVVWTSAGQMTVPAGQPVQIVARASEPFVGAVAPVQTTGFNADGTPNGDYTLVSGTVSAAVSRTSGQSVTITLTSAGSAVISDLQLRAYAAGSSGSILVTAEDQPSIAEYGRRSLPDGQVPVWASRGDAEAIAAVILGQRVDRLPTITVTMVAANATRLAQQIGRNLSDRVRVVEAHTGLNADCFVEQIGHEIGQGGLEHKTTFGLEKAPAQITGAFVLGSATSGVLGTNRLGRRGFTQPSTMFVLGTQGVLGTNILAP